MSVTATTTTTARGFKLEATPSNDSAAISNKFPNLPQSLIDAAKVPERVSFDAAKHLSFQPPEKVHTFADLGQENHGLSTMAVSEPFPLFTEEAIRQMRAETFDEDVLLNHHCPTGRRTGQVRGHCPEKAPFIYNAWTCPEVLALVSKIAGVELVPAVDYDIGHTNISVNAEGDEHDCIAPGQATQKGKYCESSFGWHKDSYPFVVVTMLSDCTGMVGGETHIRTGNGDVMKARGPGLGTAVVMQGRYVEHQATAPLGGRERISMVTSFRPKSPLLKDESVLKGVRMISHVPTLHRQYMEYRLENLEERVREELRIIRKQKDVKKEFDTVDAREWLLEQKSFVDVMLQELRVV